MLIPLSILAGYLLIAAVVLFIANRTHRRTIARLSHQMQETEALYRYERQELENRVRTLVAERTEAQVHLDTLRAKADQDKAELEKLQVSFRAEFRNLAQDILEEKSKQFKETNKESLEVLLKPFRMNITEFRERVEKIHSEQNLQTGALKSEIKNLLDLNRRITEETTNLTNALRGNSKVQGDWGEMILETILESSNLVSGIHYTTQRNLKADDGANMRPDVILNLPEHKQIVIDSKVSLTNFINYCHEESAEVRERALREHLRSVRSHVDELGGKRYQTLVDSPDFVIMFIPNEPAFMAALQNDPRIWDDAYRRKVIISSPTNLFALLKLVDDLWKRDSQNKNSLQIAEEGGKMYDKFVTLYETLESIGKGLKSTSDHYERAMTQLSTGSGNLVRRAEKLRKLGVKTTKTLPPKLTAAALEEPDESGDPDTAELVEAEASPDVETPVEPPVEPVKKDRISREKK